MTLRDIPSAASAVLVYADVPPELPVERFIDVRPGAGATFDGSRFHASIHVVGPAGDRQSYDHHEVSAIASAARTHLRERGVSVLRLDGRARFRGPWWTETVGATERRLLATARREGATLVTWTDADPRSVDEVDYDVVLSR